MSIEMQLPSIFIRYADNKTSVDVKGSTVGECLGDLAQQHPKLAEILLKKDGSLLHTYDVFINGESAYPDEMNKPVKDGDKLHIIPIIHGG
jgi:molybdopterin converting factor small subunit